MTGNFARGTGCCGIDERRLRLVLADRRRRELGLASFGRPRPDLPRRLLRDERRCETDGEQRESETLHTVRSREVCHEIRKRSQRAVSRILSPPSRALRRRSADDDHSSSPAIAGGIKRPTRRLRTGRPSGDRCRRPPYLVLLRAGFCLPPVLPRARCALTAPFHPYPPPPLRASARQALRPAVGGIFSVPLSFRLP